MRILTAILFVVAAAYAIAARNHWLSGSIDRATTSSVVGSGFIRLQDDLADYDLAKRRRQCGDLSRVRLVIDSAIGRLYDGTGDFHPSEILFLGDYLVAEGVVAEGCVIAALTYEAEDEAPEGKGLIFLSTSGDFAISYGERLTASWVVVLARSQGWRPNYIVHRDDVTLVIELAAWDERG